VDAVPVASWDAEAGRRWRGALAVIILIGLLARWALMARALAAPGLDDPDNYLPLARALAAGRGFEIDGRPSAYRPPLYPLTLAPVVAVSGRHVGLGVAALHLALGAGTVLLTASAGRRWGLGPAASLGAAAIVALDPVLVAQGRSVMTETLAAFLTAATLAALARPGLWGAGLGGLGFGLCSLCRPDALPAAVLTAAAAALCGSGTRRERAGRALTILAVTAATMAPWAARNAAAVGAPVWLTTHGGYTLALANNPVYYDEVVNGAPGTVWTGANQRLWWASVGRATRGLSEPEADRVLRNLALRVIAARPRDFARASAARLGRLWGFSPAGAVYPAGVRLATAVWTVPLWAALGWGLTSRGAWSWPRIAAPLALVGLSLVHTVYWTDLRMRAPVVPAVALIAARGRKRLSGGCAVGQEGSEKKTEKREDFSGQITRKR